MASSTIYTNVMRRVQTIHALKKAASGTGASLILLVASLYFIGREVWVARVFQNMPRVEDVLGITRFFFSAFISTKNIVQVLLLLSIFAFVWFLREISRVVFIRQIRFA